MPAFESSPTLRRRIDNINANNTNSETFPNEEMDVERFVLLQKEESARGSRQGQTLDRHQVRLQKQRSRSQSRVANETEEQRVLRLQKQRERSKSKINDEREEERRIRLLKDRERARLKRAAETKEQQDRRLLSSKESTELARRNETNKQRQRRRSGDRASTQAARENETEEQRQRRYGVNWMRTQAARDNETTDQSRKRKSKDKERKKAARQNETTDQQNKRLQRQKSRSQANRAKNKIDKRSSSGTYAYLRNISAQAGESNRFIARQNNAKENVNENANCAIPSWPEPIPSSLKNSLLQQFVQQMSMSALAEATCAVCHVRAAVKKTKKIPVNEIPGLHLLVVSQDLKDLATTSRSSNSKDFPTSSRRDVKSGETGQTPSGNHLYEGKSYRCHFILFAESFDANSPYFFNETNSMLYSDGLCKQGKTLMSTVCCKCYDSLSNGSIPKFSPANGVWLGTVPSELQDLTIPEEKLILLYRHNSCIIKLPAVAEFFLSRIQNFDLYLFFSFCTCHSRLTG